MKKKTRRKLWLLAVMAALSLFLLYRFPVEIGREQLPGDRFRVVRVLDGDTGDLQGGDRVRLLAIDAPEKQDPFHDEARDLFARVALNRPARLEFSGRRRDKYERILGYLYVDDTLMVNKLLVDSGLATVYLFRDDSLASEQVRVLLAAQQSAMDRKVGLWSRPVVEEPYYLSTGSSLRFHRPDCADLRGTEERNRRQIESREEAFGAGLSPCRSCQP